MPWFIQANEDGRNLCTILTERAPVHPRQIGPYSDLPDIKRKRLDLTTRELVNDDEYWDGVEEIQRRGTELRKLALMQLDSMHQKGGFQLMDSEWTKMTYDEKLDYYLNFTKTDLTATMDE